MSEFSLHQSPTTNLLRELRDLNKVDVKIIACQVEHIPEEITSDLSRPVEAAVSKAGMLIKEKYLNHKGG